MCVRDHESRAQQFVALHVPEALPHDHLPNDGAGFRFLPSLEALLSEFPHVRIVISSSWRERLAFEALTAPFAADIRPRILGVTPSRGSGACHSFAHREGEILAWLQAHGAANEPWVALEDPEWQFDRHKDRLVASGSFVGFDAEACTALRVHFERTRS